MSAPSTSSPRGFLAIWIAVWTARVVLVGLVVYLTQYCWGNANGMAALFDFDPDQDDPRYTNTYDDFLHYGCPLRWLWIHHTRNAAENLDEYVLGGMNPFIPLAALLLAYSGPSFLAAGLVRLSSGRWAAPVMTKWHRAMFAAGVGGFIAAIAIVLLSSDDMCTLPWPWAKTAYWDFRTSVRRWGTIRKLQDSLEDWWLYAGLTFYCMFLGVFAASKLRCRSMDPQ
jgi:hypothetical protein